MGISTAKGINIDNSCKLVYQYPRIGHTNQQCTDSTAGNTITTAPSNKRKFEVNGCSKVDRNNVCKLKMFRG